MEAESNYKPVFCSLHNISNEHLLKDHGLLSWGLKEYHGFDPFFITYKNGDYPNLKYIPGVNIEFVPKITGDFNKDILTWLRKNAKRIDVLHLYHMSRSTFIRVLTYKFFNPKGRVYLKCDGINLPTCRIIMRHTVTYLLMKICDCVSTELEDIAPIMSEKWGRRVVNIPNPINPHEVGEFRPFSERSNTIITAGRLGTKQKATEILLEAFAKIAPQIPNWTLKLAGYISENMNIASDFYAAHPELKDRVIFAGEIRDHAQLIDMYRDAKIFAFPSRHESFGIALTEAMVQGCFAVATDIHSFRTLTENFRYAFGSEVDDVDGLAKNLLYACTHEPEIESLAREGMEATRRRCDLKRCCDVIAGELGLQH